jgi:hypothetical protein
MTFSDGSLYLDLLTLRKNDNNDGDGLPDGRRRQRWGRVKEMYGKK